MGKFLVIAVMVCFTSLNAQSTKNVEHGLFKVNALIPGISYELGVGKNTTFNFDFLLVPGARDDFFGDTQFGILPGAQAEFRYYTNFQRRIQKGKNIAGNSGNYVGVVNQFFLGDAILGNLEMNSSFYNIVGFVYGIQRTRPKGFYWGISFGPGVVFDDFGLDGSFYVDAKIGWVLSKRKKRISS